MLSTTGANDVASFDVTLLSDAVTGTDYVSFEIDLSAYVGTQPRIAIQYNATDQYYLFVDDMLLLHICTCWTCSNGLLQ